MSLYAVGPHVDVGIYPLTILTAVFGPARRVVAYGTEARAGARRLDGTRFQLETPDFVVAVGRAGRRRGSAPDGDVLGGAGKQRGLELHGDSGSLSLERGRVRLAPRVVRDGETYTPVPLVREPFHGNQWSRALVDLADAIDEGRPHRAGAEHAAHVVEILNAVDESRVHGRPVEVRSGFEQPSPMPWAS